MFAERDKKQQRGQTEMITFKYLKCRTFLKEWKNILKKSYTWVFTVFSGILQPRDKSYQVR